MSEAERSVQTPGDVKHSTSQPTYSNAFFKIQLNFSQSKFQDGGQSLLYQSVPQPTARANLRYQDDLVAIRGRHVHQRGRQGGWRGGCVDLDKYNPLHAAYIFYLLNTCTFICLFSS